MLRYTLAFFAVFLPSVAQATCSGVSQFDSLPTAEQTILRNKAHESPFSQGILWRVEKNGVQSYIVGTLHLPHPRHEDTLATLAQFMPATDVLFLEMTKADEVAFLGALSMDPSLFMITEGPSLIDRLGEEAWKSLQPHLNARGLPGAIAAKYQPWFLGLTLSVPLCALDAMQSGEPGLDRMVEAKALAQGLETRSLDTIEGMIDLFTSDPLETQLEDLRKAIDANLITTSDADSLISHYFEEETQLAWEFGLYQAEMAAHENDVEGIDEQFDRTEQAMLIERNQLWLDILGDELAQTPSVVAVGALHLPGKNGLLAMLEAAGFSVTRLKISLN